MKPRNEWFTTTALKNLLGENQELIPTALNFMEDYATHYKKVLKEDGSLTAAASCLNDIDQSIKRQAEASDENKQRFSEIACKKGCYSCCLQPVMISKEEAELIIQYCKENKIKIDKKLLMRQRKVDESTWYDLPKNQHRCAFLNEKNECSIYEVRPANCRKYFVLWDSSACDPYENPNGIVPQFGSPETEMMTTAALTVSEERGTIPKVILKVLKEKV